MTSKEFGKLLQDKLTSEYGVELSVASNQQIYRSLALHAPAPSRCITCAWSS